jgi:hypothetical protein
MAFLFIQGCIRYCFLYNCYVTSFVGLLRWLIKIHTQLTKKVIWQEQKTTAYLWKKKKIEKVWDYYDTSNRIRVYNISCSYWVHIFMIKWSNVSFYLQKRLKAFLKIILYPSLIIITFFWNCQVSQLDLCQWTTVSLFQFIGSERRV